MSYHISIDKRCKNAKNKKWMEWAKKQAKKFYLSGKNRAI